jgi:hypothetical protein
LLTLCRRSMPRSTRASLLTRVAAKSRLRAASFVLQEQHVDSCPSSRALRSRTRLLRATTQLERQQASVLTTLPHRQNPRDRHVALPSQPVT